MAKGKQSDQWNHTADLICNLHRVFLGSECKPSDFHPDTMAEKARGRAASTFDARIYAIGLCGQKAIDLFREADRIREQRQCQQQTSRQAG